MSGSNALHGEVDCSATTIDERAHGHETEDVALLPLPAPALSPDTSLVSLSRDFERHWDIEAGPSGDKDAVSAAESGESAVPFTGIERHRLLIEAIKRLDLDAVKRLLREGAPLDNNGKSGDTPLHGATLPWPYRYRYKWEAASQENLREQTINSIHEISLNVCNRTDSFGCGGDSALALAIQSGDMKMIEVLVQAGANIKCVNSRHGTALHEAARVNPNALKYFLKMGTIKNAIDDNCYAAIHYAVGSNSLESVRLLVEGFGDSQLTWKTLCGWTVWHELVFKDYVTIAQYLVSLHNSGINLVDNYGRTPLFLSIDSHNVKMIALLLRNGAALSVTGEKKTAIEHITNKFANSSQVLEKGFDECIYEKENKIVVDYGILVDRDDYGKSQINVLEELVRCGHSKLLKHPMIESLIYVKWTCSLPVFYVILATYVMFLGSVNIFVITALDNRVYNRTANATELETGVRTCEWHNWVLSTLIYTSVALLLIQECVWTHLQGSRFFPNLKSCMSIRLKSLKSCRKIRFEPYVKLLGFLLACCVPLMLGCGGAAPAPWQRHVTCAALLLAWLQAMMLLSRFPGWGYYVLMFERVSINILKIIVTSACLVIGFSICFMVQFLSKPPFDGPVKALIKTLVMMTSEFDYENLFNKEHDAELSDSRTLVRLLFMVFVIFVAIVLMNFMIGVAVSDINELAAIGDVRRLEKQVELLSTLEGLGSTVLGQWWKTLSTIGYHTEINRDVCVSYLTIKKWMVYPTKYNYDAYQQTLTMELLNAILDIVKNKKQTVDKLDAVYNAVVGAPESTARIINDSGATAKALKDRIASLEATEKEIVKEIIDGSRNIIQDLRKVSDRVKSIEDTNKEIIRTMVMIVDNVVGKNTRPRNIKKIVSSKAVYRKRMLKKRK